MYSFPDLEPVCCSMSGSNCCFLSCIQVSQEAGKVVWYSHLFRNFPQFVVMYTVQGFSVVDEAKVDVFLEFPCFFYDSTDIGNLVSGSSACSISSLNIWKFLVLVLLKPGLKDLEHYLACMWNVSQISPKCLGNTRKGKINFSLYTRCGGIKEDTIEKIIFINQVLKVYKLMNLGSLQVFKGISKRIHICSILYIYII